MNISLNAVNKNMLENIYLMTRKTSPLNLRDKLFHDNIF